MLPGNRHEELIREVFAASAGLSSYQALSITELARQASARLFLRVQVLSRDGAKRSVIVLLTGESRGPAFIPKCPKGPEGSFLELIEFFDQHGIAVPKLLSFAEHRHAIVVEDVGEWALSTVATALSRGESLGGDFEAALAQFNSSLNSSHSEGARTPAVGWQADPIEALWRSAIDIIAQLHSIPRDPGSIAFQRRWRVDNYRSEAREFVQYIAEEAKVTPAAREMLSVAMDGLSETVASFPLRLSHFDFISHNIFLDREGRLRVLDFQDACQASPVRDLVAIINCRSSDEILGESRYARLLDYYKQKLQPGERFEEWFDLTALHWDFRVSGRFRKLSRERGLSFYEQWIPSTLRRLLRTLTHAYHRLHHFDDVTEICHRIVSSTLREPH